MLLIGVGAVLLCSSAWCANFREVRITNGPVLGELKEVGNKRVYQFLGIPYAEPPVGQLRFARPKPLATKWTVPLNATKPPNRCPQTPVDFFRIFPPSSYGPVQEDCLQLNIWTPLNRCGPLAVMVWIHGGGFKMGESYPAYDGRWLSAQENVIVVTINYRLGIFGFWSPDIRQLGSNWALWDQQLALKWVQQNIRAFGGNPRLVTIFGESAGAMSVSLQLLSAESRRLFRRAIAQSGVSLCHIASTTEASAFTREYCRMAADLGCSGDATALLQCMRSLNESSLLRKSQTELFVPVLTADPLAIIAACRSDHEYMLGANTDEGGMLMVYANRTLGDNASLEAIARFFFQTWPRGPRRTRNATIAAIISRMKSYANVSAEATLVRTAEAISDGFFVCPANREADAYAAKGTKIFAYEFAHRPSFSWYPSYVGATHGDEIPFVFGFDQLSSKAIFTSAERALSRQMMSEWATFARRGRPASTDWVAFTPGGREYRRLDLQSSQRKFFMNRNRCAFWNEVLPLLDNLAKKAEKGGKTCF